MFVIVSEMGEVVVRGGGGRRRRSSGGRRGRGQGELSCFVRSEWRKPFIKCLFEGGKLAWQTQARMCWLDLNPGQADAFFLFYLSFQYNTVFVLLKKMFLNSFMSEMWK